MTNVPSRRGSSAGSSPVAIRRTSASRDPFSSLQNDINNLFEDFFGVYPAPAAFLGGQSLTSTIPVDVVESEKSYKIEAELPGTKAEDVEVTFSNNSCTIKCEKEEASEDKGSNYIRRERSYGASQRTIPLPEGVDIDKAEASFRKGILLIEVPKKPEAVQKTKKLKVKEAA